MKIAFVGKGGSGRTTLSALFCRHLAARGHPVLAIDADINQHLGGALGLEDDIIAVPMGEHLREIKNYLRGDNPRVPSADLMIKTTPPGSGSRLLSVTGDNPIWSRFGVDVGGARLLVTAERRNKSSESKESDLAMAEGELAFQLARLPELEVAIFAAESRLAVLLGTYGADIAGAIRGLAKLPALPERLRPEAPRTGMAKRHQ
jgi:ABC-type cobalamin/Fe3+-siderophores transport system ATPase subunit